jgi:V/A-type H+-transporting ATPase subunit F
MALMERLLEKGCVKTMYKIAVVGDKDSVLAFKAIGIEVFPVYEEEEARKTVDRLAANEYAVIFITEQVAKNIEETIARYNRSVLPSIILIPSNQGSLNIGLQKIRDNVEKAVGVNILDNKE